MTKARVFTAFSFILALVLRCLFIDSRGLQYDDAFSILLARRSLPEIISGTAADTMPPLYYLVLHFWMNISQDIWWHRMLSILLSMGALFLLYLIVKEITDPQSATCAVLVAAISPFQIYHAQDIRMYALLQFAQAAYFYFFLLLLKEVKPRMFYWTGFTIMGVVALYSHNLAAFFLLVPNVFLLIMKKWKMQSRVIAFQLLIAVAFIPWAIMLPGQLSKIQTAFWTPRPGIVNIIQAMIFFTGSLTVKPPVLQIVAGIGILVFFMTIYFYLRNKLMSIEAKTLFFMLIFWVPLVLFFLSYLMRPVFVPRAFLISSLFFYGLVGWVIQRLNSKVLKTGFVSLIILLSAFSLPNLYFFQEFPRSPFYQAVDFIAQDFSEEEVIIHDNKLSYFPSTIYHPDIDQRFIADQPGSSNDTFSPGSQMAMDIYPSQSLEEAVDGHEIIDFIVFTRTITEYKLMGFENHPTLEALSEKWLLVDHKAFGDLEIYQFER